MTLQTSGAPAAGTPTTASPSSAATPTPAASPTPASSSGTPTPSATPTPSPAGADDGDLVTGAEKPKEGETKPTEGDKPKATLDEMKAYLKEKSPEEKLDGKTDEDIAKQFDELKAKEEANVFTIDKLTIPEDMPVPESMKKDVNDLAGIFNDSKLTATEKMQKAVDLHVKIQHNQLEEFKATKNGWKEQVKSDPELFAAVGKANDVVRQYAGTPKQLEEFQGCLSFLGLGNHPSFVRFCANIAKATGEDSLGGGGGGGNTPKKDLAELMYPSMKSTNATS